MDVSQVRTNLPQSMPMNGAVITTSGVTTGNAIPKNALYITLHMIAAAAATVIIEVTNDQATAKGLANNWLTLVTLQTNAAGQDSFNSNAPWGWIRARTTAASAATQVLMGA